MTKHNKIHLEGVTAENLAEWQKTAFREYASTSAGVSLGVDGYGYYQVKAKGDDNIRRFSNAQAAVNCYHEQVLLTEKPTP